MHLALQFVYKLLHRGLVLGWIEFVVHLIKWAIRS
jgi:hypothetical protein